MYHEVRGQLRRAGPGGPFAPRALWYSVAEPSRTKKRE